MAQAIPVGHWSQLIENLLANPQDFYRCVEESVERRHLPDPSATGARKYGLGLMLAHQDLPFREVMCESSHSCPNNLARTLTAAASILCLESKVLPSALSRLLTCETTSAGEMYGIRLGKLLHLST